MYRMSHLFVIVFCLHSTSPHPPPRPLWRGKEKADKASRLCLLVVKWRTVRDKWKLCWGWCMRADTSGRRNSICLVPNITYSSHLIISQAGGKEADVTRLSSHLGMLYFQWCSFLRGHRSTTPKWCVGVCSGPARVWVTGLAHPHQHDTAQHSKTGQQGCQQRQAVQIPRPRPARFPSMYFPLVWATGGACEEERENKNALSCV